MLRSAHFMELKLEILATGLPAVALQFFETIAEGLDQKSEFFGIGFAGRLFGDLVPVRLGELGVIRIGIVSHAGAPGLRGALLYPLC